MTTTPIRIAHSKGKSKPSSVNGHRDSSTDLMVQVRSYLPEDQVELIQSAHEYAREAHAGQTRKSGEPFIEHPVQVALRLAQLNLPQDVIAAALLHDTVEDCDVEVDEIVEKFGANVGALVDGVTKLSHIDLSKIYAGASARSKRRHADDRERQRVQSLRKLFVMAGSDRRVLLIKLADRMHNIETLRYLSAEQQKRIAQETMDIYAPLADRLGMNDIKWRLEDASFRYLNPAEYREMSRLVKRTRRDREQYTRLAVEALQNELIRRQGLEASITGRAKHLYSIARKKRRYEQAGRTFDEILDLIALRVIVANEADCYNALGVVHSLWEMIPGSFDDYISNPKPNGYRSIHTTVRGPGKLPLEVQIRSKSMHVIAEDGVAAHWAYKDGAQQSTEYNSYERTLAWLKDMVDLGGEDGDADDFIDSIQEELLQSDQVQVFTPAGDVINLPQGATPLDFAYRIHTDLGHSTGGAIVNGRLVNLNTPLESGDTIEIRKATHARGPSLDWQDAEKRYVVTSSARSKIRQWFSRQEREINLQHGRQQLKRVVDRLKRMGHGISSEDVAEVMGYTSVDELATDLGKTHEQPSEVVRAVIRSLEEERPEQLLEEQIRSGVREIRRKTTNDLAKGVVVMGMQGVQVNFPQCCLPVYGDEIVGYLTRGRGVTVHRTNCRNIRNASDPDRVMESAWGHVDEFYPVRLRIKGSDRIGLISDITEVIKEEKMNLHEFSSRESDHDSETLIDFVVYTKGTEELARLFDRLEAVSGVYSVFRIRH